MAFLQKTAVLLAALLLGGAALAQTAPVVVQTDHSAYGPEDEVLVTFTNRQPPTRYLVPAGCRAPDGGALPKITFERQDDEVWVPYAPELACEGPEQMPITLLPGEPFTMAFPVGLLQPLPPGTYRYVFTVRGEFRPDGPPPEWEAVSNAFEVVGP